MFRKNKKPLSHSWEELRKNSSQQKQELQKIDDEKTRPWTSRVRKWANMLANALLDESEQPDESIILPWEQEPFRIDTHWWTVGKDGDGYRILSNPENDIIEYIDWPYAGIQFFTQHAAKRETALHEKELPLSGKELRVLVEKKYRPKTRMIFEETNHSHLANHDLFLQKENIIFCGVITGKRKYWGVDSFVAFWCDDWKAFCIEKGIPKEEQTKKTPLAETWCFYTQPLNGWFLPVFCKREK